MMSTINPTKEAIEVFLEVKKIVDNLDDKKSEEVGSKIRARAREIPKMILDYGLVPTLSFCISKAGVNNIVKIIEYINLINEIKNIESDKIAYALYTYALLKYLTNITNKLNKSKFGIDDLIKKSENKVPKSLLKYLELLIENSISMPLYELLQPYLLQYKRMCESVYSPDKR